MTKQRTWSGLLVLVGLLVVGASGAAAQPQPEVEEFAAELAEVMRELGLEMEPIDPGDADLIEIEDAAEARRVITEVCNCVARVLGELAAIRFRGPTGQAFRVVASAGGEWVCDQIF